MNLELVEAWLFELDQSSYELVVAAIELLSENGPPLGQPLVDSVAGSRHNNMKELRPGSSSRRRTQTPDARRGGCISTSGTRETLGLTQAELAETLDTSQNRASRLGGSDIECMQVETLRRYVEAVGGKLHVEVEVGGRRIRIA